MNTVERNPIALKHRELTSEILRLFFAVYNEMGYGFLESVYRRCMVIGLREVGLNVEEEVPLAVWFRGSRVGDFRADLLVEHAVLVELKSVRVLDPSHEAQLLHYLKSTEIEVGLLLNFGSHPQFRRLIFDNARKKIRMNPCESVAGFSA